MIKIRYLIISAILLMLQGGSYAQKSSDDFDSLVRKIESDYPGYKEKVKPDLFLLKKELRGKIKKSPDSLLSYLNRYVSYFKDGHLRVERNMPTTPSPKKRDISSYGKVLFIDKLSEQYGSHQLEGVWTSLTMIITKPEKQVKR